MTHDISHLTCADFLRAPGVQTPLITRFSTVVHERGKGGRLLLLGASRVWASNGNLLSHTPQGCTASRTSSDGILAVIALLQQVEGYPQKLKPSYLARSTHLRGLHHGSRHGGGWAVAHLKHTTDLLASKAAA